jgi:hypothetical protein
MCGWAGGEIADAVKCDMRRMSKEHGCGECDVGG